MTQVSNGATIGRNAASATPVNAPDPYRWWWDKACTTARQISTGVAPPTIDIWGPVWEPGEHAVLSTDISYSRLYGGSGTYTQAGTFAFGRPAVMAGALAVTAAINYRRKTAAARDAVPRWRDHQRAQVIVTTQRMVCATDTGTEHIWWEAITDLHPDLSSWSLTLGFGPEYSPMLLSGPAAPALSVWAAAAVFGASWCFDPRLALLNPTGGGRY